MSVLTRVTAPFIFGTIIVLNMLQNSLFATLAQPLKGLANADRRPVIGVALVHPLWQLRRALVRPDGGGADYAYEIWLANALLSVTFPFLIFLAAYFGYWPSGRPSGG